MQIIKRHEEPVVDTFQLIQIIRKKENQKKRISLWQKLLMLFKW